MDKYVYSNAVISKFCKRYNELKKDLPIRPSEMGVLNIIVQQDRLFTPLAIAELLEVSKPMITSHISVLERKGYITKEHSKEDKRSFFVIPTTKAKELVHLTAKEMNKDLAKLEELMGQSHFERFLTLLDEANEKLKEIKGE